MKISEIVTATLLSLLIISCEGCGKSKKHEPLRRSKKKIEVVEKKKEIVTENESEETAPRNNGNYRKPTQREKGESKLRRKTKGRPIVQPEEDPAKASSARIEKRVQLELDIWKARKSNNSILLDKLKDKIRDYEKDMSQAELDEAFKRLKDIKKRM